nr:uncharacterized protein LOC126530394 [Dermacentor andersoni]
MGKLIEVFTRFGYPEQLITDNASYFTAKLFVDSCAALGIKHRRTTTYHAQANPTERVNRNIKHMLVAFAGTHNEWDACLSEIGFASRSTVNRSTGYTPATLNLGRELLNPVELTLQERSSTELVVSSARADYATGLRAKVTEALRKARRNLSTARAEQKAQYDRSHREVHYKVGDLVLRRNHVLSDASKKFSASLAPKWTGPYRVRETVSSLVYRLADLKLRPISRPVHVCDLKPYYDRGNEWPEENALPRQQAVASGGTARRSSPVRRYTLPSRQN